MTADELEYVATHIVADSKSGCWLWTNDTKPSGYATWRHARPRRIHRLSYLTWCGPLRPPLQIDLFNTQIRPQGYRACRACRRIADRKHYFKVRAAALAKVKA